MASKRRRSKSKVLRKTLTFRKGWNFLKLYCSFQISRIFKKSIHWGNPSKIGIEPTTSCNLRCPECPSGLRSFTRPTGMLELDSFKSMTDELHKDLVYMLMYFQGEPYLNPRFLEMAAYAAEKGVYVATSTNAHYLSEKNAEATVRSGIQEVLISIDGASQATYEQYRIGGNLEKVKEGTRNLVAARDKLNSETPVILLQFLVTGANEHELEEIQALGDELGVDKVVFKTAQIYDYEKGHPLIPKNERYARYREKPDGTFELKNKLKNQCWKLWMGAEITWDGRVLPCCFDKDAQHEMGKLPDKSFAEIWRSDAYESFRAGVLHSRKSIDICTNCSEGTEIWTN